MRRHGLSALVLVAGLAVSVSAQAAELREVKINYGLTQFLTSTAPVFSVPEEAGFWKEEGLTVESVGANGGSAALQQTINNETVMTFTGVPNVLQLREKGAPVKVIASAYNKNLFYPVVLKSSPIKSIKDMKGKTIGVCRLASACEYWFDAIFKAEGGDPSEVTKVAPGDGAAALHAVKSGRVDVLEYWDAGYVQMELQGAEFRKFDDLPYLKNLTFVQGLIAKDEVIENDKELLIGLLRGIAKAAVFSDANPEAAVRLHWKRFPLSKPAGVPEEKALADGVYILKSQLVFYQAALEGRFGKVSMDQVVAIRDLMHENNVIKEKLEPSEYYDPRLLEAVNNFDREKVREYARNFKVD